jgi:hypothetical protein
MDSRQLFSGLICELPHFWKDFFGEVRD